MIKLVSWNVNGLRACVNKGFNDFFKESGADIFCVQETKLQEGQIVLEQGEEYMQYWNYALKKGYSGTAVFTRIKPLSVRYGIEEDTEPEGRIITLEFAGFYLVNVYTPNAKRDLTRLEYRMEWEDRFRNYLLALDQHKPVVVCGDLNVAHQDIDLKNAKSNRGNSGFTDEERGKMTTLLDSGLWIPLDIFTLTQKGPIAGGPICRRSESAMSAGGLIISLLHHGWLRSWWRPVSSLMSSAATIVRWC